MSESTFHFGLKVRKNLSLEQRPVSREKFFEWLWSTFSGQGLLGVHEGTLLNEEAAEQGLETDSWTVDAGEAPRERDWVESQSEVNAELYFDSRAHAEAAARLIAQKAALSCSPVVEQKPQDWDAQWKASFLSSGGLSIPPCWRIIPAWTEDSEAQTRAGEKALRINPGAGFGTGTHETTQLCLQAIAENWPHGPASREILDFGSGSGILSIGSALLGGTVTGIEIDPLAIDNAVDNARLNNVSGNIAFFRTFDDAPEKARGPFQMVIANILKPVLLEFADQLISRLAPGGTLILSGLIEKDVAPVTARYSQLLTGIQPELKALHEWRALVWKKAP